MIGIDVAGTGKLTVTVSSITLYCGQAIGAQTPEESARYFSPTQEQSRGSTLQDPTPVRHTASKQVCPTGQVAIGVHGRSGDWLDAMGLMCDVPRITSASQGAGVPRLPGDRGIGQGASTVPAMPAPAKRLGRAVAAPPGAGAAPLNKAAVLAPPQSNPLAAGVSLKQAVIPAPAAARSPLQKAAPAALNAQPQAAPTTLPAQAPSALR